MPLQCNTNAIITCIHGGTFKINAITAPTVDVGGASAITVADVAPGSTPMMPCPNPTPCVKLVAAISGYATKENVNGSPALLHTTKFTTAPGGTASVTYPGQGIVHAS